MIWWYYTPSQVTVDASCYLSLGNMITQSLRVACDHNFISLETVLLGQELKILSPRPLGVLGEHWFALLITLFSQLLGLEEAMVRLFYDFPSHPPKEKGE